MNIDKLIARQHTTVCVNRFSSLMNIDKLIDEHSQERETQVLVL